MESTSYQNNFNLCFVIQKRKKKKNQLFHVAYETEL